MGPVEGMSRGELLGEVRKVEEEIRRRLPIGSQISARGLRDELFRQVSMQHFVTTLCSICVLPQQLVLTYESSFN
jgi:DNA replication licensing factor MCM5